MIRALVFTCLLLLPSTLFAEQTLVVLKPDCVKRHLIGRVVSRFDDKGLKIVAMRMLRADKKIARQHYLHHLDKPYYNDLESYLISGPIVAMVLEGEEAVKVVRKLIGPRDGLEAPIGTIRGDFSKTRHINIVHASDTVEAAQREIKIYFKDLFQ